MEFTAKHSCDSPTMHGKSYGAMLANEQGMYSEVQLQARLREIGIRLSRAEIRDMVCGNEWHHVSHLGRIVEMYFGEMPDDETVADIQEYCRERTEQRRLKRQACPSCAKRKEVTTHCIYCGFSFKVNPHS